MNIEQAKRIPLGDILLILKSKLTQQKNGESWYLSPFRNERTASFQVREKLNIWYDFGLGKGGDSIDMVRIYLETQGVGSSVPDALRWLKNMMGYAPRIRPVLIKERQKPAPKLSIVHSKPIEHTALVKYLESRGIPLALAKRHLVQVTLKNKETGKTSFALAMRNESGGHEIRNKFFKGSIGRKDISVIRGLQPKPDGLHIFEGMLDYLSAVMQEEGWAFKDDSIILNSISIIQKATGYIYEYGYRVCYTWMDNDEAGKKATASLAAYLKTQENLLHRPMNDKYGDHKDVNAWHMHKLGL